MLASTSLEALCSLRPSTLTAPFSAPLPNPHRGTIQDCQELDDEDEDDEELAQPPPAKQFVCDIWPFAFSLEYHKKIFALTATSGQPAHVVILTTSGHPNSALAALEAGAKVHVMFDRVSKHSEAHGEQLLTGQ